MSKWIVLCGMMGCGKSTVGALVARRLSLSFVDLDMALQKELGRSPADVIRQQGVQAFRKAEATLLSAILMQPKGVLSLGGGTLEHPDSRRLLQQHELLWLQCSAATCMERSSGSETPDRPLLPKSLDEMEELLLRRSEFYTLAMYKVDADSKTALEVAETIVRELRVTA